jgi:hypothetical protein
MLLCNCLESNKNVLPCNNFFPINNNNNNRTSKEGGEEAWRLLASNVKCCPQDIGNRPCENAQDTACLLERAPTSSSLFRSGGSGKGVGSGGGKGGVQSPLDLEWSPKQFDKLSEKAQKKVCVFYMHVNLSHLTFSSLKFLKLSFFVLN